MNFTAKKYNLYLFYSCNSNISVEIFLITSLHQVIVHFAWTKYQLLHSTRVFCWYSILSYYPVTQSTEKIISIDIRNIICKWIFYVFFAQYECWMNRIYICGCFISETQCVWKKYDNGGSTLGVIMYISFWNRSVTHSMHVTKYTDIMVTL